MNKDLIFQITIRLQCELTRFLQINTYFFFNKNKDIYFFYYQHNNNNNN